MTSFVLQKPVTLLLYAAVQNGPRGVVTHAVAPSGAKGLEERWGVREKEIRKKK